MRHNRKEMIPESGRILITGALGYLGQSLIRRLSKEDYKIMAYDFREKDMGTLFQDHINVSCYDLADLNSGTLQMEKVDLMIHCAFARPHHSGEKIAGSLEFTSMIFDLAAIQKIPAIINISSENVYGTGRSPLWTEATPVAPETLYGQAKYATELMLKSVKMSNKHIAGTSIRLSAMSGGQEGLRSFDFLAKFVSKVLNKENIEIVDGKQRMERIDVRDAADAIAALLKTDMKTWKPEYNLGVNQTYALFDIAEMVVRIGGEKYGLTSEIIIRDSKAEPSYGMDSSMFFEYTGWKPQYEIEDTIESLFDYFQQRN